MRKNTVGVLVMLVVSVAIIARTLLDPAINLLPGWDYLFLLASLAFCFSLIYLVDLGGHNRLEIWSAIGPTVAILFLAIGLIAFFGLIIMIFLPDGWKIFSTKARVIIMEWSLIVLWASTSCFTPR